MTKTTTTKTFTATTTASTALSTTSASAAASSTKDKEVVRRFRLPRIKVVGVDKLTGVSLTTFPFLETASHVDQELVQLFQEHRPYAQNGPYGGGSSWKAFHDACQSHVDSHGVKCLEGIGLGTLKDRLTSYKAVIASIQGPEQALANRPNALSGNDAKELFDNMKQLVGDVYGSELFQPKKKNNRGKKNLVLVPKNAAARRRRPRYALFEKQPKGLASAWPATSTAAANSTARSTLLANIEAIAAARLKSGTSSGSGSADLGPRFGVVGASAGTTAPTATATAGLLAGMAIVPTPAVMSASTAAAYASAAAARAETATSTAAAAWSLSSGRRVSSSPGN